MHILKLFVACILLCCACRSISFDEFRPESAHPPLLPSLFAAVDTISLETFYWNDHTIHHPYPYEENWQRPHHRPPYVRDIRIQDAIMLFDREVKDNLTNPKGKKYGYITCKIVTGECRYSPVSAMVSLATFFVPNLFGFPFNNHMTHLELEVEVYDSRQQLVARYAATGYSKVPIALWRGYRTTDAYRLSNIKAFKTAMQTIKEKITEDYPEINHQLLASGPLTARRD